MISLSKSGSTVIFDFDNNSGYLQNGAIEVPVNSLSLVIDSSDMVTFKKSASNDIFVSANIAEFGMTKAELESWFKENAVGSTGGGGDITSGEVKTMIDESISGKADSSAVTEEISAAVSGKADTSAITETIASGVSNPVSAGAVYDKVTTLGTVSATTQWYGETGSSTINLTFSEPQNGFEAYVPTGESFYIFCYDSGDTQIGSVWCVRFNNNSWSVSSGLTDSGEQETGTFGDDNHVIFTSNKFKEVAKVEIGFYAVKPNKKVRFIHDAVGDVWIKDYVQQLEPIIDALESEISGKAESRAVTEEISAAVSGKADSSAVTEEISAAVSGKQDTLSAGTGIEISGNVISATGGGSSNLPISAGTGTNSIIVGSSYNEASGSYSVAQGEWTKASGGTSHAEGTRTKAYGGYSHAEGSYSETSGAYSHAEGDSTYATAQASHSEGEGTSATSIGSHSEGRYTQANGMGSHSEGYYTIAENEYEHASGKYNISNTGESTSAQTLFSVGNGGWDETLQETVRHNAFEIRKNGDIYFFDGTNDVKLQEALDNKVDTSDVTTAVTSGSTDVVTSGGVYAKMGGMTIVKITESDYQSLSVKDENVLYIVIPDPNP